VTRLPVQSVSSSRSAAILRGKFSRVRSARTSGVGREPSGAAELGRGLGESQLFRDPETGLRDGERVDAGRGLHPRLVEEVEEVLGADVAGGAGREGATPDAAGGGI